MTKNRTQLGGLGSDAVAGAALAAPVSSRVTGLDRRLARLLLRLIGNPPLALVLWNGEEITASTDPHSVRVMLRDRGALFRVMRNPGLHFGDLYSAGRIEVEGDLGVFLDIAYAAMAAAQRGSRLARLATSVAQARPRANSLSGSRDNIHHHYDLGNEFYALWLDREEMQYTCAYYPYPDMTLEQAQVAKLHHVCRKLQLRPGDTVVEAGCGWGGLARFMARHYGVKVTAYNISREQIAYARERAVREGLDGQVSYVEDDYRNIDGDYDVFVSVGMLEHVGRDNYRGLGAVVDRCLRPAGRALIHSIGRNRPQLMNAWIEKRIFPGAYPPTLREMMDILEPHDFSVLDVENLRLHYARTLDHWLARFETEAARVAEMFDAAFVRAWRLYLSGSAAAFRTGHLQLFQVVFARGGNNDLPWSRIHLYH